MSYRRAVFKPDQQHQALLFPPTLGDLLDEHHRVRLISRIVDGMDLSSIYQTYKGGGSSAYSPKMILKVLLLAYSDRIYSCREIERACRESVPYLWLCGFSAPDHNTLYRFRKYRLQDSLPKIHAHVLATLFDQGYINLDDYYLDGTKMEAISGRYTAVWAKRAAKYSQSVQDRINAALAELHDHWERQDADDESDPPSPPSVDDSEAALQAIAELNEVLCEQEPQDRNERLEVQKARTKLRNLAKNEVSRLADYERQLEVLDGRSSYAKTDTDAVFMRTKDDHLRNGQLKPSYNVQAGVCSHFVVNLTVHNTPSDMACFEGHLELLRQLLTERGLPLPSTICADAGYGRLQNYEYCKARGLTAYVKYSGYDHKKLKAEQCFQTRYLDYDAEHDVMICPQGEPMVARVTHLDKTSTGYPIKVTEYHAPRSVCQSCPLRLSCLNAGCKDPKPADELPTHRVVKVNAAHRRACLQAKELLDSEQGQRHRQLRNVQIEGFFAQLKANMGRRRLTMKGLVGARIELGLTAVGMNLRRYARLVAEGIKQGGGLPSLEGLAPKMG